MAYRVLHRSWRWFNALWWLMPIELLGCVGLLTLFGIAQPNTYRESLWKIGYEYRFNSSPNVIVFAHVNHRPIPTVPFVWSQRLTDFNVAIAIISLFHLITKMVMIIMKIWFPLVAVLVNLALVGLLTTSVYGQMGPDYLDPRYPSAVAWYIRMGCDLAEPWGATKYCKMAKGTFAVTVFVLAIYTTYLVLAIWSMIPSKNDDVMEKDEDDSMSGRLSKNDKEWEMNGLRSPRTPKTAQTPYTPRTLAFNTLERKLPLRNS